MMRVIELLREMPSVTRFFAPEDPLQFEAARCVQHILGSLFADIAALVENAVDGGDAYTA